MPPFFVAILHTMCYEFNCNISKLTIKFSIFKKCKLLGDTMRYSTEKSFIDGLEKIIIEKKKINVMTICEASGISRQSFYKYFIDLDDFMFWVHKKLFIDSFVTIFENQSGFYRGSFVSLFKALEKHKKLYCRLFEQDSRNGFRNIFVETSVLFNLKYNSHMNADKAELEQVIFNLNLFFRGYLYYMEEFVNNRLHYDIDTIAGYLANTMPDELKKWDSELSVEADVHIIEKMKTEWILLKNTEA